MVQEEEWNQSFYLLLMEAHKFSEVMGVLNMSLHNIPLRFYHIHLKQKYHQLHEKLITENTSKAYKRTGVKIVQQFNEEK